MNIHASCPHCSSQFSFDDSQSGQAASCPHCQGQITLAAPVPSAPIPAARVPAAPTAQPGPTSGAVQIVGNTVNIEGTFYQISTINSVRVVGGSAGILSLIGFLFCAVLAFGSFTTPTKDGSGYVVGVMAVPMGLVLLFRVCKGLLTHSLMLTTNNGEVAALRSMNKKRIQAIANDIVGAMSAR